MAENRLSRVVSQVAAMLGDAAAGGDAELVARFVGQRDESAFEALVRRHGKMVLGVCRRLLGHEQDAEDAFQATFLVLARNAATIRRRGRIGTWLHGVARRTALEARRAMAKRRAKEASAVPRVEASLGDETGDLRAVLDEELAGLPEKYREVAILCDLEGQGRKKVAEQLGCPEGTVKSRLTRARAILAKRLARR